jgi:hypothetical protein
LLLPLPRFFVTDVDPSMAMNTEYFKKVASAINNPRVAKAFFGEMMARKISGWDAIRDRPMTSARRRIISVSSHPILSFLAFKMPDYQWHKRDRDEDRPNSFVMVSREELRCGFRDWCKGHRMDTNRSHWEVGPFQRSFDTHVVKGMKRIDSHGTTVLAARVVKDGITWCYQLNLPVIKDRLKVYGIVDDDEDEIEEDPFIGMACRKLVDEKVNLGKAVDREAAILGVLEKVAAGYNRLEQKEERQLERDGDGSFEFAIMRRFAKADPGLVEEGEIRYAAIEGWAEMYAGFTRSTNITTTTTPSRPRSPPAPKDGEDGEDEDGSDSGDEEDEDEDGSDSDDEEDDDERPKRRRFV